MGEEVGLFSELGINLGTELASRIIDSTIFDLTYKKKSVRDMQKEK